MVLLQLILQYICIPRLQTFLILEVAFVCGRRKAMSNRVETSWVQRHFKHMGDLQNY